MVTLNNVFWEIQVIWELWNTFLFIIFLKLLNKYYIAAPVYYLFINN